MSEILGSLAKYRAALRQESQWVSAIERRVGLIEDSRAQLNRMTIELEHSLAEINTRRHAVNEARENLRERLSELCERERRLRKRLWKEVVNVKK